MHRDLAGLRARFPRGWGRSFAGLLVCPTRGPGWNPHPICTVPLWLGCHMFELGAIFAIPVCGGMRVVAAMPCR